MARVFDLSGPIVHGAEWFGPPFEPVQLRNVGSLKHEGWVSHVLHLSTISGTTYIETAAHVFAEGPSLDEIPVARLLLDAHVWHCRVVDREVLRPRRAQGNGHLQGRALVILCGWYRAWNRPEFAAESPFLGAELQEAILASRPALLASDAVHFDALGAPAMPFLRRYFRIGGLIVSPLCPPTGRLPRRGRLIVAPLRLIGVNSSPCRVFFVADR